MNIKTFKAKTLREGLEKIREEFGDNAKVMHTRQIDERSFFGLRKHQMVEITAAECESKTSVGNSFVFDAKNPIVRTIDMPLDMNSVRPTLPIEGRFIGLRNPLASGLDGISGQQTTSPSRQSTKTVPIGSWRRMTDEQLNPSILQTSLINKLEEIVRFSGPFDLQSKQQHVAALIGTTGTGKTSTIAKIAAHYKLREFKKVGLLTIDMFRIGAVEQIQKYAEMLELPFETVSDPGRIHNALRRLADCELILMDTPGTNPKNKTRLQMIAEMLETAKADDVVLVLPANATEFALSETFRQFEMLDPTLLTLTKLDEFVSVADLYRFLKNCPLPLSFLCMGQNISEDIEVAGPVRLASLA